MLFLCIAPVPAISLSLYPSPERVTRALYPSDVTCRRANSEKKRERQQPKG